MAELAVNFPSISFYISSNEFWIDIFIKTNNKTRLFLYIQKSSGLVYSLWDRTFIINYEMEGIQPIIKLYEAMHESYC